MNNTRQPSNKVLRARAEASAWIVQLHGLSRSAALEAGFRRWLAESPENARQFERVSQVWEAGSMPLPSSVRRGHRWVPLSPATATWTVAAAVALMTLGYWLFNVLWLNPSYTTAIGEQRTFRLEDGTRITLNSDTRISVSYRATERKIRISRGEAYFEVTKDPTRPFLVDAGVHRVRALGTVFVVRYGPQATAVTLVEGKVAVSQDEEGARALSGARERKDEAKSTHAIVLTPGERLTFASRSTAQIDEPRIEVVTAWRRGEVVLDGTPLSEAISEMNRYDRTRLVVPDPKVAAVPVSGIYQAGSSETFAIMVARLYGLEVTHEHGQIILTDPNAVLSK